MRVDLPRSGGEHGGEWGKRGWSPGLEVDGDDTECAGERYERGGGRSSPCSACERRNSGQQEGVRERTEGAVLGGRVKVAEYGRGFSWAERRKRDLCSENWTEVRQQGEGQVSAG